MDRGRGFGRAAMPPYLHKNSFKVPSFADRGKKEQDIDTNPGWTHTNAIATSLQRLSPAAKGAVRPLPNQCDLLIQHTTPAENEFPFSVAEPTACAGKSEKSSPRDKRTARPRVPNAFDVRFIAVGWSGWVGRQGSVYAQAAMVPGGGA